MDRVTRYPIFSNPYSPRVAGLALDEDTGYSIELVDVGPRVGGWSQQEPQGWPADHEAGPNAARTGASRVPPASPARLPLWPPRPEEHEDEELTYFLGSRDSRPGRPRDLERERWAVTQDPAVRKGSAVATLQGPPGLRGPRSPGRPELMSPREDMVDREQIDFLAARQQFLSLERANGEVPPGPSAQGAPVNATPRASQAPKGLNRLPQANGHPSPAKPQAKEVAVEEKSYGGWSPGASVQVADTPGAWSQEEASPVAPKETPIEREIRLAQERERDLREQRGLRRACSHQELVEIPTRPLLAKLSLAPAPAPRRDRGRPSLYVQRDIAQETQREEDHRRAGLRGSRAATPDWTSRDTQPGLRRALSSDSILSLAPDASAADPAPEVRKVNRIPPAAYQPYLGLGTPQLEAPAFRAYGKPGHLPSDEAKTVGSPRAAGAQRRLSASGKSLGLRQAPWKPQQAPLQANGGVVRREHFLLRPLRFKIPDGPLQTEDPRAPEWPVPGAPMFRQLHRSQSSELLEREVEDVLRREREVAEERRNALLPQASPMWDEDSDPDSRSSSRASGTTGSYSVTEPIVFAPLQLHSRLVWTAEAPSGSEQAKKKEQWYAGINPSDHIDSEVLGATRVGRHKNAMAERWEAHIYASEDDD